ncbi:extracellular solute-binding protein [Thalassotalea sp. PP2-459]|uniref:extracellular solute-binding protein n=1 Tax=Thalassotalea sp. PP2-459 TaxID=1742724 RepID=UPI00094272C9|nr:extracellular solute-binding protein [Thalassotalea sp. PP2-459]OKY26043.1 ABC transporter substrate-binding protein [Thalassotalea sp. PP2-459]
MHRRTLLQTLSLASLAGALPGLSISALANSIKSYSVEELPKLEGELTLYLGRGEGGLYEDVLNAIKKRNPNFDLKIRRGPTAALANMLLAEAKAGVSRADLFWAVDSGAIGQVAQAGLAKSLPTDITAQLKPEFRFHNWAPITGRIRTLPYNPTKVGSKQLPTSIMDLPNTDLSIAWAPSYASFQSFVTAMRLLEGEAATIQWLKAMKQKTKKYAGELGVVMAVERGEADIGLANHYYTLRLKSGKPDANLTLAFTNNDAGCLINASGIISLTENKTAIDFIRYLLTTEVQSYLSSEAYEIPLAGNNAPPQGIPTLDTISPPNVDLTKLADVRPTLTLMRKAGVL